MAKKKKLNNFEYLRNLAERLRHVPVMYGTDDGDISRLYEIAKIIQFPPDGMMRDADGNRSIFDDVDE